MERAAAGGGARSSLGFTAEPPLQGLATHAALLPVLVELGAGSPRLVGGEAWVLHHSDDPAAAQQEPGGAAAYRAEAPGRCRCDSVEVFCFLDTCEFGDGGLMLRVGSHKAHRRPPLRGCDERGEVPDGQLNLCPAAGDIVVVPAGLSLLLPWRNRTRSLRLLTLRVEAGAASHAQPQHHGVLSAPMAALVRGHFDALRPLCRPPAPVRPHTHLPRSLWYSMTHWSCAQDPGSILQPDPERLRRAWRSGRAASTDAAAPDLSLLDMFGILHLRNVLSPEHVAEAREAFERARAADTEEGETSDTAREVSLEMLATHPRLVPSLLALRGGERSGVGAPHLMLLQRIHQPARVGEPSVYGPAEILHCHREDVTSSSVHFESAADGCLSDNHNVFVYLEDVRPGDGGLAIVPASNKAQFSRPRSLFWPYSNHQEHPVFGADRHATAFTVSAPHRCLAEPLSRFCASRAGIRRGSSAPPATAPASCACRTACCTSPLPPATCEAHRGSLCRSPAGSRRVLGPRLILPEVTSHCVLPWQPTDRDRRVILMRYYSGDAYEERVGTIPPKHPSRVIPGGFVGQFEHMRELLAPCTLAMIDGEGVRAWDGAPRL